MAAVVNAHAPAFSPETFLAKYVARLGEVVDMPSPGDLKPTLEVLTLMMYVCGVCACVCARVCSDAYSYVLPTPHALTSATEHPASNTQGRTD